MNKKIIIDIPFNVDFRNFEVGDERAERIYNAHFGKSQTKWWIDHRIEIFMRYTAKSLMNQTNQDFLCVVRYTPGTEGFIIQALNKYPKLPDNIVFTYEADQLIEESLKGHEYIYHVRIDSDNMYEKHFIETINQATYEEGLECLLCQEGYIYEEITNRLATIFHYSPSLYVYIFKVEDYLEKFRYQLFEAHFKAIKRKHKVLEGRNYLVTVHGGNLDNTFVPIVKNYKGVEIQEEETKNQILQEWGII